MSLELKNLLRNNQLVVKSIRIFLIAGICVLKSLLSFAQECDSKLDPFQECPDTDEASPLDSGVWFLLAAGSFYGAKRIQKQGIKPED
jgi:hypothetical protein